MNYSEFSAQISNKIISILETGKLSWRQTWKVSLPHNFVSKRRYNGMNLFSLFGTMIDNNFTNPGFLTFLQASQKGLKINKGSKGSQVIFWKTDQVSEVNVNTEEIESRRRMIAKFYYVFNISQTDYAGEPEMPIHEDAQSLLDSIIRDKAIVSSFHPIKASYRPSLHDIIMPSSKQFSTPEEYYSTFFHEIIHWSGKEMQRELNADNKTIAYAKEELIAEFGSSFLCALCGIENTFENSAAYIQDWIEHAKLDKTFIPGAITSASKAVEFLTKSFFEAKELKEAA
ncbi:MAG: DUF1738 domain-containing protein [Ignavibacteria bacterium]|nr:DUF1738 domain-containing protein [Ignavibacteria bacterium]PIX93131.1 MAG: hypothetical protein COZ25_12180 [Ignavibacteria bacterium CG_4_10_14_3_um_filter_37_18]